MLFAGIDLAWSNRNGTGVAVINGDKTTGTLTAGEVVLTDAEIMAFLHKHIGMNNCIVAIDAPLCVPNESGRRPAEELVGKLFRQYDAGAHPANRQHLTEWTGEIRGKKLVALLKMDDIIHNPYFEQYAPRRIAMEVYPHPAMVVIFNLPRIFRYKAKQKRDYPFRWREFQRYQTALRTLETGTPQLHLPEEIIGKSIEGVLGKALKEYEDMLDAIFCAYIAHYCWVDPTRCAVLGDMNGGYILTPVFPSMKTRLQLSQSQKTLDRFR